MAERAPTGGGLSIGHMYVRVPGGSHQDGARLASHLRTSLGPDELGSARALPQLSLKVTVGPQAGPESVAEAIARALRRRLG